MSVNWTNPYEGAKDFPLKGSLHTHTPNPRSSCGSVPIDKVIELYKGMGYSFMAVTNHHIKTDVGDAGSKEFCVLPGIETDIAGAHHFGVVHADGEAILYDPNATQQEMIDRNSAAGGLVTLHHPDWQLREHYTIDELLALKNYDGIEIYNSVIERLDGSPLSTAKWDRLLTHGRRVLGFANQDFHGMADLMDCCNAIAGRDKSPQAIFDALKSGRFYCHHGVKVKRLGRNGGKVFVETENAKLIRFIGFGGKTLEKIKAPSAEIEFKDGDGSYEYIRVECLGEGDEISFSQPFFRSQT